jgi:hypothetical protein
MAHVTPTAPTTAGRPRVETFGLSAKVTDALLTAVHAAMAGEVGASGG